MKYQKKYSVLELLLSSKWQWIRKRSKCVWIYDSLNWVKFYPSEVERLKPLGIDLIKNNKTVEDWR